MDNDFISREIAEFSRRYKLPAKIDLPAAMPTPEFSIPPPAPSQQIANVQPVPRVQISKWKLPVIQLTCDPSSAESQSAEEIPESTESEYETETEDEYETESYESESESYEDDIEDDYQQNHYAPDWLQQLKAISEPKGMLNNFLKK